MKVVDKVYKVIEAEARQGVQAYNRASTIGHPCLRYLYYCRTAHDQRQIPPLRKRLIWREGERQELAVIMDLMEAGFKVKQAQRDFVNEALQLVGHPDGFLEVEGEEVLLEIKGVNPYSFSRISDWPDLLKSKFWWERGWYYQVQAYLLLAGKEKALMLLKNKVTGELKEVWVEADEQVKKEIESRCHLVNMHVSHQDPPERPEDMDEMVCRDCEFYHLCLPDTLREPIEVRGDEDEIAELLDEREKLEEAHRRYQEINDLLKKKLEGVQRLIVGNWLIEGKEVVRKPYTVPETRYWRLSYKKIL